MDENPYQSPETESDVAPSEPWRLPLSWAMFAIGIACSVFSLLGLAMLVAYGFGLIGAKLGWFSPIVTCVTFAALAAGSFWTSRRALL